MACKKEQSKILKNILKYQIPEVSTLILILNTTNFRLSVEIIAAFTKTNILVCWFPQLQNKVICHTSLTSVPRTLNKLMYVKAHQKKKKKKSDSSFLFCSQYSSLQFNEYKEVIYELHLLSPIHDIEEL